MLADSFRDNELKALLEMRGLSGAEMTWAREGVEGDEVGGEAARGARALLKQMLVSELRVVTVAGASRLRSCTLSCRRRRMPSSWALVPWRSRAFSSRGVPAQPAKSASRPPRSLCLFPLSPPIPIFHLCSAVRPGRAAAAPRQGGRVAGVNELRLSGGVCAQAYPAALKDPYLAEGTTFKINVVSVGGHMADAERTSLIQTCFKYIDFKGKVLMDQTRKGVRAGLTLPALFAKLLLGDTGRVNKACVALVTPTPQSLQSLPLEPAAPASLVLRRCQRCRVAVFGRARYQEVRSYVRALAHRART